MPRVHVSLPQELYDEMKSHGWSASEIMREAIRERLREEERERAAKEWYDDLVARLGPPTPEELEIVDRILGDTRAPEPRW